MTDRVKLQPGDYVSTEGMDEEQYDKIVAMMRNNGAYDAYAYPSHAGRTGHYLMWDDENDIDGGPSIRRCSGRHLTIAQVLGTNTDPIQALKQRRKERDAAEAAYQEALKSVREELGDGFTLDDNAAPVSDLPPGEWREGDFVECVSKDSSTLTLGAIYRVHGKDKDGDPLIRHDDGEIEGQFSRMFRFHSRPA